MKKNLELEQDKKIIDIIRGLLIVPFYIIGLIILYSLNIQLDENSIIVPVLIFLPPIIGLISVYKLHNDQINKTLYKKIILLIIFAIFLYCNGYIVNHNAFFGGVISAFLFYPIAFSCRILLFKFLGGFTEKKRIWIYFGFYLLFIISTCTLSFLSQYITR